VGHVVPINASQSSSAWIDEQSLHDDFLVLDMIDSYHNVSTKTSTYLTSVLSLGAFEYVVKIDDDVFLSPLHPARPIDQYAGMHIDYAGCMQHTDVIKNASELPWAKSLLVFASHHHLLIASSFPEQVTGGTSQCTICQSQDTTCMPMVPRMLSRDVQFCNEYESIAEQRGRLDRTLDARSRRRFL
jgi:hypothetical protein